MFIKPSKRIKNVFFSVINPLRRVSLSFIVLGTSFVVGIVMNRCPPQTHVSFLSYFLFFHIEEHGQTLDDDTDNTCKDCEERLGRKCCNDEMKNEKI